MENGNFRIHCNIGRRLDSHQIEQNFQQSIGGTMVWVQIDPGLVDGNVSIHCKNDDGKVYLKFNRVYLESVVSKLLTEKQYQHRLNTGTCVFKVTQERIDLAIQSLER